MIQIAIFHNIFGRSISYSRLDWTSKAERRCNDGDATLCAAISAINALLMN
jgi:hypothetical protein